MKAKANSKGEKDYSKSYMSQINWDWLFLKGQLVLGSLILIVVVIYLWLFS